MPPQFGTNQGGGKFPGGRAKKRPRSPPDGENGNADNGGNLMQQTAKKSKGDEIKQPGFFFGAAVRPTQPNEGRMEGFQFDTAFSTRPGHEGTQPFQFGTAASTTYDDEDGMQGVQFSETVLTTPPRVDRHELVYLSSPPRLDERRTRFYDALNETHLQNDGMDLDDTEHRQSLPCLAAPSDNTSRTTGIFSLPQAVTRQSANADATAEYGFRLGGVSFDPMDIDIDSDHNDDRYTEDDRYHEDGTYHEDGNYSDENEDEEQWDAISDALIHGGRLTIMYSNQGHGTYGNQSTPFYISAVKTMTEQCDWAAAYPGEFRRQWAAIIKYDRLWNRDPEILDEARRTSKLRALHWLRDRFEADEHGLPFGPESFWACWHEGMEQALREQGFD